MVNLEWYRTFKAIYQHGTLTKAASELMLSQPNVSIQLASLESYIGQKLFIRLPRQMVPTQYGKMLYTQVVESIDHLERIEVDFKKSNINKQPSIKLGVPSEMFLSYLSRCIHLLEYNLIVEYGLASNLLKHLRDNQLDIAIITRKDSLPDTLVYENLYTERLMVVCNVNHDTDQLDRHIQSNDLKNAERWLVAQQWYAYDTNLPLIRRFWKSNFAKRPVIVAKATIPDHLAILEAITCQGGLAVMSDIIAGQYLKAGKVRIAWSGATPSTNQLYLVYNKSKIDPQVVHQVREFIKQAIDPYLI